MIKNIEEYLSGKYLYGDNLSVDEMKIWYEEEGEGYANLGAREGNDYTYVYHALNDYYGYRHLNLPNELKILGFGSAYGEELMPVIKQAVQLTILDPSDAFVSNEIHGVPCKYIKPEISGKLPFDDGEFDLITAFGVLHHIPNVTAVMSELSRVTKRGGHISLT